MGVHIVELRVWTASQGQFPALATLNAVTIRLTDPHRRLARDIRTLQGCEWHLHKLGRADFETSLLKLARISRIRKKAKRTETRVEKLLKRAAQGRAAVLDPAGEEFFEMEYAQQMRLPESFDLAERIDMVAFESESLLAKVPTKRRAGAMIKRP